MAHCLAEAASKVSLTRLRLLLSFRMGVPDGVSAGAWAQVAKLTAPDGAAPFRERLDLIK
jgi:hypothetical protein